MNATHHTSLETARALHILGISGSVRGGSYNTALLRAATALAPEGMTVKLIGLGGIPLYDADVDAVGTPEQVVLLKHEMAAADGLLIATPEYNHSISGILKNAIDWASRPRATSPLNHKPVAIMGAGGSFGTLRAQLHLREILAGVQAMTMISPELLVRHPEEKFDHAGLLIDEPTRAQLRRLLEQFGAWIDNVHPVGAAAM